MEYLERLNRTGPTHLHILYMCMSKFNTHSTHTHTHTHTLVKFVTQYLCLSVFMCAIDVGSRSSFASNDVHTSSVSADAGKTIDRVLKTHLLQTVIKLAFVANVGFIR